MIMDLITELKEHDVNTEEALARFMNNSELYVRMLGKFPAAVKDADVSAHFNAKDYETAVSTAHTLKGVTGNLSLTPLFKAYTEIVALLRAGEPDKAEAILKEILPVQEKIIACIEKHS